MHRSTSSPSSPNENDKLITVSPATHQRRGRDSQMSSPRSSVASLLYSTIDEQEDHFINNSNDAMNNNNTKDIDDEKSSQKKFPVMCLPWTFMILLFAVSAAQNMSTSLLTLLFAKTLEPQQTTYFWTFMSWVYWCSPFSGWVSDICGNRKLLLIIGLIFNIAAWCLTTWQAGNSFTMFVVWGVLQNASMLFVNAAINGALVEVVKAIGENTVGTDSSSSDDDNISRENSSEDENNSDSTLRTAQESLLANNDDDEGEHRQPNAIAVADNNDEEERINSHHQDENLNYSSRRSTTTSSSRGSKTGINNDDDEKKEKDDDEKPSEKKNQTMLSKSGDTQSTAMLARTFGSVIGAVIQTFALVKLEIRDVFIISIILYILTTVLAVFTDFSSGKDKHNNNTNNKKTNKKRKIIDNETFCSRIQSLFKRLRLLCDTKTGEGTNSRSAAIDVVLLLVFIFCNNMLPDATSFYSSYIFDAFKYPNWFNSTYQLGNLLGALFACEVYRRVLAPLSQTRVFFAGCFFAAASYLTGIAFCTGFTNDVLHIPNSVYLMIDTFVVGFLNRLAFMPILHVASVRCPKGFEAVVFELFSLAAIGGSTVANLIAIQIANSLGISRTNWDKLWILMVIAASSRILPAFVVPYLPPPREKTKKNLLVKGKKETDNNGNDEKDEEEGDVRKKKEGEE